VRVSRWARETLAGRLMLGQTIVLIASFLTAGLVASLVGPQIFHGAIVKTCGWGCHATCC
jgi:two-component system sensor histidine kinase BaeS